MFLQKPKDLDLQCFQIWIYPHSAGNGQAHKILVLYYIISHWRQFGEEQRFRQVCTYRQTGRAFTAQPPKQEKLRQKIRPILAGYIGPDKPILFSLKLQLFS